MLQLGNRRGRLKVVRETKGNGKNGYTHAGDGSSVEDIQSVLYDLRQKIGCNEEP